MRGLRRLLRPVAATYPSHLLHGRAWQRAGAAEAACAAFALFTAGHLCSAQAERLDCQGGETRRMVSRTPSQSRHEETCYKRYMSEAKRAFAAAAGTAGSLNEESMMHVLHEMHSLPHGLGAADFGPLMLRLFDENGDGEVTEEEFLLGQAIVYAAAKAGSREDLQDLCWRSLDLDQNGAIDRTELTTMVRIMLTLGAIREKDQNPTPIKRTRSASLSKRIKNSPMKSRRVRKGRVEDLVDMYMVLYTGDTNGTISKADFDKQTALVENFWLLIRNHEILPALFLSEDGETSPITQMKQRGCPA